MPIELWIKNDILRIAPISEVKRYFSKCIMSEEILRENFETMVCLKEQLIEHYLQLTSKGTYVELILEWEEDAYIISYSRHTKEWKALSGKNDVMISKIRAKEDLVDIGDDDIKIECFIDHSMIEFYLNDRKGMTLRGYPFCGKNRLCVRTDGICRVSLWEYDKNAD
ncbi:MAG: GH32 C-terminal domain-containing protein [Lachnospiraceae bacterium]|nr:GH32 C-terminal domain-containing protein [Lachnospiraceae bacterium]